MATSDNASTFIDLYNRLERLLRQEYPDIPADKGAIAWATRQRSPLTRMREELDYCREVRNLLQHSSRLGGKYLVMPSDEMLDVLRRAIAKVERPRRAIDLCTRRSEVLYAEMSTPVLPVLTNMAKRSYTHIPLLDDGRVVGVFSAGALLSHMGTAHEAIGPSDTFALFGDAVSLDQGSPGIYAFVAEVADAYDIAQLFQEALRKQQRLHMVFVTAHGKQSERLLGVITAWDMAAFF